MIVCFAPPPSSLILITEKTASFSPIQHLTAYHQGPEKNNNKLGVNNFHISNMIYFCRHTLFTCPLYTGNMLQFSPPSSIIIMKLKLAPSSNLASAHNTTMILSSLKTRQIVSIPHHPSRFIPFPACNDSS